MENTRLKELLELVRNRLINEKPNQEQKGICKEVIYLWITDVCTLNEKEEVLKYLKANKPTPTNEYAIFTQSPYWINFEYWWLPIYSDIYEYSYHTIEIRIAYLTKLIENIK